MKRESNNLIRQFFFFRGTIIFYLFGWENELSKKDIGSGLSLVGPKEKKHHKSISIESVNSSCFFTNQDTKT